MLAQNFGGCKAAQVAQFLVDAADYTVQAGLLAGQGNLFKELLEVRFALGCRRLGLRRLPAVDQRQSRNV